jgi:hypothetical protein
MTTVVDSDTIDVVYLAAPNDPCRILSAGSVLSVSYSVLARVNDGFKKGGVSGNLGALLVDWIPSGTELPYDHTAFNIPGGESIYHGPLAIGRPLTIRFPGPPCYIECAPFETELQNIVSIPRIAVPFEMTYCIGNKTAIHQTLFIRIVDSPAELLLSGLVNGEVNLAPLEKKIFSYTVVPTRPGSTCLPALCVSSSRHNAWVVKEDAAQQRSIFVLP